MRWRHPLGPVFRATPLDPAPACLHGVQGRAEQVQAAASRLLLAWCQKLVGLLVGRGKPSMSVGLHCKAGCMARPGGIAAPARSCACRWPSPPPAPARCPPAAGAGEAPAAQAAGWAQTQRWPPQRRHRCRAPTLLEAGRAEAAGWRAAAQRPRPRRCPSACWPPGPPHGPAPRCRVAWGPVCMLSPGSPLRLVRLTARVQKQGASLVCAHMTRSEGIATY